MSLLDSIKKGISKLGNDDFEDEAQDTVTDAQDEYEPEEEYEQDGEYADEGEEYDDAEYEDDSEYEDDAEYEDEGEYEDDAEYDEADEYKDEGEYGDEEYGDETDDSEYDDADYDGYEEEEYDEDEGDLGYNPSVFENLDAYSDEDQEDEAGYEPEDEYETDDGDVYDDDGSEGGAGWFSRTMDVIQNNEYLLYALLVLLPPLGLFALWRARQYEPKKRWILTAVGIAALIIWIIILWPKNNNSEDPLDITPVMPDAATTVPDATVDTQVVSEPTAEPTATPHPGNSGDGSGTGTAATYVWVTGSGLYYHTDEHCGGITNASKVTLDAAVSRGKTACPDCAGGVNTFADNTTATVLYATPNGKNYHTDPNCSGMKNASVVTESDAVRAGKTACPVCIGYYGTEGGKWYHSISNCQGMQNAVTKTKAEWEKLGKTACPTCLSGSSNTVKTNSVPTETQVFCTANGKYFHTKSDCTGMKGATQVTISRAVSRGKTACPTCVTKSAVYVFANPDGTYYHTTSDCSGMKNAQYVTARSAINAGKKACTKCNANKLGFSSTVSAETGEGAVVTTLSNTTGAGQTSSTVQTVKTNDTATYVYATSGGTYYHTKSNCSGMKGAQRITINTAVKAGKKACPTCVKTADLTVFMTDNGTYFHTDASCSGMKNAVATTASRALSAGKTACPTCAKSLTSAQSAKAASAAAEASKTVSAYASANAIVYIKLGAGANNYYHSAAKCTSQSFKDGLNVTLEYALGHGYKACPSCNPPSKIST